MVFAIVAIGFLGWIVWGHHMFVSGMNPTLGSSFMVSTLVIAVPSAVKEFNWLGAMWGGGNVLLPPPVHGRGDRVTLGNPARGGHLLRGAGRGIRVRQPPVRLPAPPPT